MMLFATSLQSCERDFENKTVFVYNETTGECEDSQKKAGFNVFNIDEIRRTKNAECLDLSGQRLVYLLDTSKIENFQEGDYNILEGYNFKGSKFDSALIFFDYIFRADFSGADLRNIQYGYAFVRGKIDQYTLLPVTGQCETENDSLYCSR